MHLAAQPSHDWAAKEPFTDFTINAGGTLNILENMRKYAPNAKLACLSTNKVYGDRPNLLPLIEMAKRYEVSKKCPSIIKDYVNTSMTNKDGSKPKIDPTNRIINKYIKIISYVSLLIILLQMLFL